MENNILRTIKYSDGSKKYIPNPCTYCTDDATYGRDNVWYCLKHWLERKDHGRQSEQAKTQASKESS